MFDEHEKDTQTKPAFGLVFIEGDQDAGLIVCEGGDAERSFTCRGVSVKAMLSTGQGQEGVRMVTLKIEPEAPVRFRVEWFIPESALNAAMTLNGGLLISPFSDVFPTGGLPVPKAGCGNADPLSTLRPGQFQSINFNWEPGDTLTAYLVMDIR